MKLVVATPLYPPEPGGPSTYAKELFEGLSAHGVEVTVVKFSDVRHLPKFLRHYMYSRKVYAAAQDADAVLALDPVSVGLPALSAAKKAKKPFYVKIVGDYAWEQGVQRFGVTDTLDAFVHNTKQPQPVRLLQMVEKKVANAARKVIVPSAYLKGIVTAWGIAEERITVIPNAVTLEEGGTVPAALAALPRPLVVSVGRLVPWKGMDGIIDAVAAVRRTAMPLSLALVGDGPLLGALEARAKETLKDNYCFPGRLSHADILATIQHADVFVLNSTYEGLSHLLIEARLLGTPIIATRAGGNAEVVEEGVHGHLIPVGDTAALTAALTGPFLKRAPESSEVFAPATMLKATAALLHS